MFRKLIALSLIAAGVAAALKKRQSDATTPQSSAPSPAPSAGASAASGGAAGAGSGAADAGSEAADAGPGAAADDGGAAAIDEASDASDLAAVRPGQTEATIEAPIAGAGGDEQAAIPDISDEDPLVRQQENAAAADAASIGGTADSATADTDPEMRPVYEGSGGDTETFETTDEQGR